MRKFLFFIIPVLLSLFSTVVAATENLKVLKSLEEAESIALANNNQVNAIKRLVEKAKEERLVKISDWLPKLNLISEYFATDVVINNDNTKNSFATQLALTQTLFTSDTYYNIKIADLLVNQMNILKATQINAVIYQTRQAYYRVLLDQKKLDIAAMRVEIFKLLALRMEERFRIGTSPSLNVNQSQILVANALSYFYEIQKQLTISQNLFTQVLGYEPGLIEIHLNQENMDLDHIPDLRKKFEDAEHIFLNTPIDYGFIYPPSNPLKQTDFVNRFFSPEEIKMWEKITLKYRPNLQNAKKVLEIARETVRKAKGLYYPEIYFNANCGAYPAGSIGSGEIPLMPGLFASSRFLNQNTHWGAGITFKWNLFDGLKTERTIRSAKEEMYNEKFSWDFQVQEAYRAIRDQIASLEKGVSSYLSSKGSIRLAEQTLAQASEQIDIGYISIFDYQTSVENLIETQTIFFQSQFDLINAYYGLRYAAGIDVENSNTN